MKDKVFNSKILLFGEYSILKNSKGLSIPFTLFNGSLKTPLEKTELSKKSNSTLLDFFKYLKSIAELDFHSFKIDLENGIYFDSTIPVGYGVGSSGAIVAAVYEKYAQNKIVLSKEISNEKLINLKEIFSKMESFFHGKSSGLDPLNIYLGKPILINSINEIEVTKIQKILIERGLTQTDLYELIKSNGNEIGKDRINRIVNGKLTNFHTNTAKILANALGVKIDDVVE